jgi:hypothetical protein
LTLAAIIVAVGLQERVRLGVIGDYGFASPPAARVAKLVKSWNPDHIVTLGDNNYDHGLASSIDRNIGQYYSDFIGNYRGRYGAGAKTNRFWPALGNHDYANKARNPRGADPYLAYFTLPGNERYYDVRLGPVHLFVVNSDVNEPDGTRADSRQADWLRSRLAASTDPWQAVVFHHPPYSSGQSGPNPRMRWPFRQWGADLVMSGHDHVYERIELGGMTYIVNGLGGARRYRFVRTTPASRARFRDAHGALRIDATATRLEAVFLTVDGREIDRWFLTRR